jgi:hypothetical protein
LVLVLDTTVEIYTGDLNDALEKDLEANGKLFVQMPSSAECEEKSDKIIEIISKYMNEVKNEGCDSKYMNEVKNEGCDSKNMEDFLKFGTKFKITSHDKIDEIYNVYIEKLDNLDIRVSFRINDAKFSSLNSEIKSEFNQDIDLSQSSMKFEVNNDLNNIVYFSSIGSIASEFTSKNSS